MNASNLIVVHNHPTGCPNPSEQDITVTRKIMDAGMLMDIPLKDHIIVTRNGYYSFIENGTLNK